MAEELEKEKEAIMVLEDDEEVKVFQAEMLHPPTGIQNACVSITAAALLLRGETRVKMLSSNSETRHSRLLTHLCWNSLCAEGSQSVCIFCWLSPGVIRPGQAHVDTHSHAHILLNVLTPPPPRPHLCVLCSQSLLHV